MNDWMKAELEELNRANPRVSGPELTTEQKIEIILQRVDRIDNGLREMKKIMRALVLGEKDEIKSIAEAAEYCGVSRDTIRRWLREGKIKKSWLRGREGILLSDLNTAIDIKD